jgi:hypothetical protein
LLKVNAIRPALITAMLILATDYQEWTTTKVAKNKKKHENSVFSAAMIANENRCPHNRALAVTFLSSSIVSRRGTGREYFLLFLRVSAPLRG